MASAEGVLHRPEVMARVVLVDGRRRRQQVGRPRHKDRRPQE